MIIIIQSSQRESTFAKGGRLELLSRQSVIEQSASDFTRIHSLSNQSSCSNRKRNELVFGVHKYNIINKRNTIQVKPLCYTQENKTVQSLWEAMSARHVLEEVLKVSSVGSSTTDSFGLLQQDK